MKRVKAVCVLSPAVKAEMIRLSSPLSSPSTYSSLLLPLSFHSFISAACINKSQHAHLLSLSFLCIMLETAYSFSLSFFLICRSHSRTNHKVNVQIIQRHSPSHSLFLLTVVFLLLSETLSLSLSALQLPRGHVTSFLSSTTTTPTTSIFHPIHPSLSLLSLFPPYLPLSTLARLSCFFFLLFVFLCLAFGPKVVNKGEGAGFG